MTSLAESAGIDVWRCEFCNRCLNLEPERQMTIKRRDFRKYGYTRDEALALLERALDDRDQAETRLIEAARVISRADVLTSKVHDAVYAKPYSKEEASEHVWNVHNVLRAWIEKYMPEKAGWKVRTKEMRDDS